MHRRCSPAGKLFRDERRRTRSCDHAPRSRSPPRSLQTRQLDRPFPGWLTIPCSESTRPHPERGRSAGRLVASVTASARNMRPPEVVLTPSR
jgi:hypothetical protein